MLRTAVIIACTAVVSGCANYQSRVQKARRILPHSANKSVALLKEKATKASPDQLVFLLEYATALQVAGRFEESAQAFNKAYDLSDQKDYISVSKQLGSVLMTQGLVQYSGKPFEKDLITVMSAINYLAMNQPAKARVEIKRGHDRVNITKKKNSALSYLGGLVWETLGEYDSALIAYKEAYTEGYRFADLTQAIERVAGITGVNIQSLGLRSTPRKVISEIILIYAQGWSPRLDYDLQFRSLPRLVPMPSKFDAATLKIGGLSKKSSDFYSVKESFYKDFEKELANAAAKRTFSYVVKEGTAYTVSKEDKALGQVIRVLLHSSDWADLRHWSMLPEALQVARMEVTPGMHSVEVYNAEGGVFLEEQVDIQPGQKKFIFARGF